MSRAWVALLATLAACASADDHRSARPAGPPPPVAAPERPAPPEPEGARVLDRIAVLGASVSAGLAAPPIAKTLAAGLPADAAVLDVSTITFFQDPFASGRAQVDAALGHRPTLVIALDFLFWFAYADAGADERGARLDHGLALLAELPGALAVGDLPDMRTASPRILDPAAVPGAAELAAMNEHIRAWAAARPHTIVLPLAAWTAPLLTGDAIELAPGERVPAGDLMFLDGLHPNPLGTWHLLDLVDRALEHDLAVPADRLRLARPSS